MLTYLLYGLFVLACVVLIVVVLLQPGKSDAGALFSSSLSSTAFGPRGTQTLLAKMTIGAAALFMLIALMLSLPAVSGSHSVLQSTAPEAVPSPAQQPSPATPASSPSASQESSSSSTNNANANSSNKTGDVKAGQQAKKK